MDFDEDPDYLDLEDILTHTQSVNCTFLLDIPGLDFLWPSHVQDAEQDVQILLPFWMAKTMYTYSMIDIEVPKVYKTLYREILQAEPRIVDLHRAGPNYYRFGKLLLNLRREKGNNLSAYTEEGQRNKFRREEGDSLSEKTQIAQTLMDTFHNRRHWILDHANNKAAVRRDQASTRSFVDKLDNLEMRLFQVGRQQEDEMNKWNSRKIELVTNNALAARLIKKRRQEAAKPNQKHKPPPPPAPEAALDQQSTEQEQPPPPQQQQQLQQSTS